MLISNKRAGALANRTPASRSSLAPTHARGLYRQKLDKGSSPRTVNYIHTTLLYTRRSRTRLPTV
jgi:hypothetical protein